MDPTLAPVHRSFGSLIASTGFVGPVMVLAGLVALVLAVKLWLDLGRARVAPAALQKVLEQAIAGRRLDDALAAAEASRTFLGAAVAGGLLLHRAGHDEMLANVERTAARESIRYGNRVANLARFGGGVLLAGALGTTLSTMNALLVIEAIKEPRMGDFALGIGQALVCVALALLIALFCFLAYFLLDARLTKRTLDVREIAEDMVRDAVTGG